MPRRQVRQTKTFQEMLVEEAQRFREEAEKLAPGLAQELLLRRARQAESASHVDDWLSSPGLKSSG